MSHDFMALSPEDFEQLVGDLLSSELGVHLESFKSGKDNGIDLRHATAQAPSKLIIQCKRYQPHHFSNLLAKIREEVPKLKKLKPERYILCASVPLSPAQKDKLAEVLGIWLRSTGDIFGATELNALLRKFPHILQAHFKLWLAGTAVLERVINARVFSIADDSIEATRLQVSKLVMHSGFSNAVAKLEESNHLLIVGMPGVGKTTLAKMLACHYLADGYEPIFVVRDIGDAWAAIQHSSKTKVRRVVIYDDFLGQVRIGDSKFEKNEEQSIFQFIDRVSRAKNIKFVMTTREYIFEDARKLHGVFDQRADDLVRFTLRLEDYAKPHRARVLFNHLFFSDLPKKRLEKIVQSKIYRDIVEHENFNPRIVETICSFANTRSLSDDDYIQYIQREFDNPKRLWDHPFRRQLSLSSQRMLVLIWTFGGQVVIGSLQKAFSPIAGLLGVEEIEQLFRDTLKELDGNFISTERVKVAGKPTEFTIHIRFHNPSIRDFMDEVVSQEPSRIDGVMFGFVSFVQFANLVDFAFGTSYTTKRNLHLSDELMGKLWVAGNELRSVRSDALVRYVGESVQTYVPNSPPVVARRTHYLLRLAVEMSELPVGANDMCCELLVRRDWEAMLDRVNSDSSQALAILALGRFLKTNRLPLAIQPSEIYLAYASALETMFDRPSDGIQLYDLDLLVQAALELNPELDSSLEDKTLVFAESIARSELGAYLDIEALESEAEACRSLAAQLIRSTHELSAIAERYDAELEQFSPPDDDGDLDREREHRPYQEAGSGDIDQLFAQLVD